uniref:Golgin A4 n=1 Tax=Leptobrachium leishanense TaxID=445787 RepID=A0A8C5N4Q4_9ANUR
MLQNQRQDLDSLGQEKEKICLEKLDQLKREHEAHIRELKENDQQYYEARLKEKEQSFQAHIQEMNDKTLEKLDVKQTELEALSAELSEALKLRQELEQKPSALEDEIRKLKHQYEAQLHDERVKHEEQISVIENEKELLTQGVEKGLKEEINHLKMLLDGKLKEIEELKTEKESLKEAAEKTGAALKETLVRLEEIQTSHQSKSQEEAKAFATQLLELQEILKHIKEERDHLKGLGESTQSNLKNVTDELDCYKDQVQNLTVQVQEQSKTAAEKFNTLQQQSDAEIQAFKTKVEELQKSLEEQENEIAKLNKTHNQTVSELNQIVSSKEKEVLALQEEYQTKTKSQEVKFEKMKQRIKDIQDASKKKYAEMESKLKKELEKKQLELNNKEKQFNEKMLEMAQASSTGINEAMSQLEVNHKEQLQNVKETHQKELEDTAQTWEKKLCQQVDELKEKHELELQEKDQAMTEVQQQLSIISRGKEELESQIIELKESKGRIDISFNEIQGQLQQASAQVLTFTDSESILKSQIENLEKDCITLGNEKKMLEEQLCGLKTSLEEDHSRISELASKLQSAEEQCQLLENAHNKDRAEYEKELLDKLSEKEAQCNQLLLEQEKKLDSCCKELFGLLESTASELTEKYNDRVNRAIMKITFCEKKVCTLTEAITKELGKVLDLQTQLEKLTAENDSTCTSLNQTNVQLQEKEHFILSMKNEIQALLLEKEVLQKEGGSHMRVADEKESCITQLKKELSDNINNVTSLTETLKDKEAVLTSLHTQINELKLKLENSVDLAEKESSVACLTSQHKDSQLQLENQIKDLLTQLEAVNEEKASSLAEADKLKNRLDEWKKKAEVKFAQNQNTVKDLQEQIESCKEENKIKDEKLLKLSEEFEHNRSSMEQNQREKERAELDLTRHIEIQKSRIEELDEQLSKLSSENKCLLEEVEKQKRQQNVEKEELVEQLKHVQSVVSEKDVFSTEASNKVLEMEKENNALKEELAAKQIIWQQVKTDLSQNKDKEMKELEHRVTAESANKLAELKKKAEQKIASVKKQLMSQLEEKEQSRKETENQLLDLRQKMENEKKAAQEGLSCEKEEQAKKYASLLEEYKGKEAELEKTKNENVLKEQKMTELEDKFSVLQKTLDEREQIERERDMSSVNENEAQKRQMEELSSKYEEQIKGLQENLAAKYAEMKTCEDQIAEKTEALENLQALFDELQSQENTLRQKLAEAEGETQKFRKEVSKLQKDMRSLRKEHNQELGLLKKELTEESEERIKHEQEDMELKHNSSLKQLMRQFNTQLAEKEREVEIAVQETISKAQEVEAELMQSHHIEATQLHKKIAEKEDDLKRTVKKYEELMETREEEMTGKVTELQKEHENLQEELLKKEEELTRKQENGKEEQTSEEVQINTLEDQLKNYSHGVYVTPLGTPYKDVNHRYTDVSLFGEPTEFEYLRKVMFEYMMGRETKTMAKVITTVLRFPADQAQKILEKEDARPVFPQPRSGIF